METTESSKSHTNTKKHEFYYKKTTSAYFQSYPP
jgi:hypothetical protein